MNQSVTATMHPAQSHSQMYQWDPEFVAEGLSLAFITQAAEVMKEEDIDQTELAALMGVTKAYVSKLLTSNRNLTLLTAAKLACALKVEPAVALDQDRFPICLHVPLPWETGYDRENRLISQRALAMTSATSTSADAVGTANYAF